MKWHGAADERQNMARTGDPVDTRLTQRCSGRVHIIQREEDGLFQIGWYENAAGPFESRGFAEAVAEREVFDVTS
jgi:hypothetical protein